MESELLFFSWYKSFAFVKCVSLNSNWFNSFSIKCIFNVFSLIENFKNVFIISSATFSVLFREFVFIWCWTNLLSASPKIQQNEREIVSPGRPMATTNSTFVMRYFLSCLALFHQFYITPWTANLLAINFGLTIIYSRLPSFNLVFILSFSLSWYYRVDRMD